MRTPQVSRGASQIDPCRPRSGPSLRRRGGAHSVFRRDQASQFEPEGVMETQATILHADLDAFYVSVEQLLDPAPARQAHSGRRRRGAGRFVRGQGVRRERRHAGRKASELCPQLPFVGGHFREYQQHGDQAIEVLRDFTPLVERISIDEAFPDVAGCTHLFGAPTEIAQRSGGGCGGNSVYLCPSGWRRTKHLAKIASQVAKPDGLLAVDPTRERRVPPDLSVRLMWGVGPVTQARLAVRAYAPSATSPIRRAVRSSTSRPGRGQEARIAGLEPRS